MIKGMAWLIWALVSVGALAWSLSLALNLGAWGPFWALLGACVGIAGWLGEYARARNVGLLGSFGVLATICLRGADQPFPLIEWQSFSWWPIVAAWCWLQPGWFIRKRIEYWTGEALGLVVMALAFFAYWTFGAAQILGVVELGFLILLIPSIGGGLGRFNHFLRDRRGGRNRRARLATVEVQTSHKGDLKEMGRR